MLHDLGVVAEGSLVNAFLVFRPPVVWICPETDERAQT
jgi:hypothetical protein